MNRALVPVLKNHLCMATILLSILVCQPAKAEFTEAELVRQIAMLTKDSEDILNAFRTLQVGRTYGVNAADNYLNTMKSIARLQQLLADTRMLDQARRLAARGGIAAVVTVAGMAGVTAFYNSRQAAAAAQSLQINQQLQDLANQRGECEGWYSKRNFYVEAVDRYNAQNSACSASGIGAYINYYCYGLTAPVNDVGAKPGGC